MKKILISAFISINVAFLVYSMALLFWGEFGLSQMSDLNEFKLDLAANIALLENQHLKLQQRIENLNYDRETIMLEARQLGYFNPDETVIHFKNVEVKSSNDIAVGELIKWRKSITKPEQFYRMLSTLAFVLSFILQLLWSSSHKTQELQSERRFKYKKV